MRGHDGENGEAELPERSQPARTKPTCPNEANLPERSQPARTKPTCPNEANLSETNPTRPNEPNATHRIDGRPAERNKPRKSNDFRDEPRRSHGLSRRYRAPISHFSYCSAHCSFHC